MNQSFYLGNLYIIHLYKINFQLEVIHYKNCWLNSVLWDGCKGLFFINCGYYMFKLTDFKKMVLNHSAVFTTASFLHTHHIFL